MNRRSLLNSMLATVPLGVLSACDLPGSSRQVRFQFGWITDAHQAGFYVAREQGLYSQSRLEVELRPGGLDASPVRLVASGSADMAQAGGVEQLILARAEQLPVVALSAMHRETPHALISLDGPGAIRSPQDMRGKRIAVAFGDTAEVLLRAALQAAGLSESDVDLRPFRFDLTPLVTGQVDAVTGFSTDQPATLLAQGRTPVVMSYTSLGVHSYGYTLFCAQRHVASHRDQIRAFLVATREGWRRAFSDPEGAIQSLSADGGAALEAAIELEKLNRIRSIMLRPDQSLDVWTLDSERLLTVQSYLRQYGGLSSNVDIESLVGAVEGNEA